MGYRLTDWLSCPACREHDEVSLLAHETEMVAECYSCGQVSEFVIGEDIPLNGLEPDTIAEVPESKQDD